MAITHSPGGTVLTNEGAPHIDWYRMASAASVAGLDILHNIKTRQTYAAWVILAVWIDWPIPRSRKQKRELFELIAPSFPHVTRGGHTPRTPTP